MSSIVPHRFLFRYSIAIPKMESLPNGDDDLLALPASCALPNLGELDEIEPFAEVRAAYNEAGFGLSFHINGKSRPVVPGRGSPDGIDIWIDTRNTQNIHRASRFCHWFHVQPVGVGKRPSFEQRDIPRARDEASIAPTDSVQINADIRKDGYDLEVWISQEALHGFDVAASPKLGFYYRIMDAELGEQFLGVDLEFPVTYDPSMWATLELC